jgi:hypothetical protein
MDPQTTTAANAPNCALTPFCRDHMRDIRLELRLTLKKAFTKCEASEIPSIAPPLKPEKTYVTRGNVADPHPSSFTVQRRCQKTTCVETVHDTPGHPRRLKIHRSPTEYVSHCGLPRRYDPRRYSDPLAMATACECTCFYEGAYDPLRQKHLRTAYGGCLQAVRMAETLAIKLVEKANAFYVKAPPQDRTMAANELLGICNGTAGVHRKNSCVPRVDAYMAQLKANNSGFGR